MSEMPLEPLCPIFTGPQRSTEARVLASQLRKHSTFLTLTRSWHPRPLSLVP